ncbi:MAG: phenylalanine--tRNA ligase subunit alpha [Candidatus Roizmanbacteria bacterium]
MDTIDQLIQDLKAKLQNSTTFDELEKIEIDYLGRNGLVNEQFQLMKSISPDKKKEFGAQLNTFKQKVTELISIKKESLISQTDSSEQIDFTLPGKKFSTGSLHMVTLAIEEITSIFNDLGFIRMSYPEVEWEYFSFEALNFIAGHPARDDVETFFIDAPTHEKYGKMVLTPHTSSGQIREMFRIKEPPIRMINIGKTYRPNSDATHNPMFHQFEGMCVDKNINITHLKGTIEYFAKAFFGPDRQIRLRPHHFQFTEPSFEIDITCGVCGGTAVVNNIKCKICKSGWLELGGSGIVHPNVLKAGGIDTSIYSGWAFGFGVERTYMMKDGLKLDDMRTMYGGDVNFLEQF